MRYRYIISVCLWVWIRMGTLSLQGHLGFGYYTSPHLPEKNLIQPPETSKIQRIFGRITISISPLYSHEAILTPGPLVTSFWGKIGGLNLCCHVGGNTPPIPPIFGLWPCTTLDLYWSNYANVVSPIINLPSRNQNVASWEKSLTNRYLNEKIIELPSSKVTVCYWKWPIEIAELPHKMVMFHICLYPLVN